VHITLAFQKLLMAALFISLLLESQPFRLLSPPAPPLEFLLVSKKLLPYPFVLHLLELQLLTLALKPPQLVLPVKL
jgi:hypothetical protein